MRYAIDGFLMQKANAEGQLPHRERLTPTEMNLQPGFAMALTT